MPGRQYDTLFVTRYMGAKYRLLDFIVPRLESLLQPGATFVDLMAGTQAVGYAMKRRYRILSTDVQRYALAFSGALIVNNRVAGLPSDDEVVRRILDGPESPSGWFTETYADTYFSRGQCLEIENIRTALESVREAETRDLNFTALAYAMSLCQSTPGHFAQYMPSTHPRIQALRAMSVTEAFLRRRSELQVVLGEFTNIAACVDALSLDQAGTVFDEAVAGSLAYLDPPYSPAQYSRFYHLLETVFLNDQPLVSHKGLYRADRYQSPFCSPHAAESAFERIISACAVRGWNLAVSYSSHGLVSVERLVALCRDRYRSVNMALEEYPHSMQGRGTVRDRREILVSCSSPR